MTKYVGILTAGGDSPGLNAALRGIGKAAIEYYGMQVIGFHDGFRGVMLNFNDERMGLAASSLAFAKVAYEDALDWARLRNTFGAPLIERQVIRHKLVDMAQRIAAGEAYLESIAWRVDQGEAPIADLCMLKNHATQTLAHCASEAVQILGGAGYMRGSRVERIAREVKVNAIGGGAEEIMKDLASRHLGW